MQTAIHQPHGETEWKLWHVVYWIITLTNIEAERSKRKLAVARWTWSRKDRRQGLVMWNTNTRVGQSVSHRCKTGRDFTDCPFVFALMDLWSCLPLRDRCSLNRDICCIFFREDVFTLSVMPSCEVSFVVKLVIISPLFSMSGVVV